MNVTAVAAKISDIDTGFWIPDFDVFVDLAAREQDQVICWIEAHCSHNCLMAW